MWIKFHNTTSVQRKLRSASQNACQRWWKDSDAGERLPLLMKVNKTGADFAEHTHSFGAPSGLRTEEPLSHSFAENSKIPWEQVQFRFGGKIVGKPVAHSRRNT